ncbi:MAG TPA: hypothetical protein DEG71_03890 [Clostridiales bacterium]|nr:hypothetical protein [Clostridiales bacterium]
MIKRIKNNRGDASVFPIMIIMIVSFISGLVIYYMQFDNHIIILQKIRYSKAVDMAVSTAVATIELSPVTEKHDNIGYQDESSGLEDLSMGHVLNNQLKVDKDKFAKVFYTVLMKNFQVDISDTQKLKAFRRYVPLKAIIEYDTMYLSSYEDDEFDVADEDEDGDKDELLKVKWHAYRLFYYDEDIGDTVFLTLSGKCYTVLESLSLEDRFLEANRNYVDIDEDKRNRELATAVRSNLEAFVNLYKENPYDYQIKIGHFDEHKFMSAINNVTFFCMVEGIPIKSIFSNEPNNSFFAFNFGGASIKRADQ